MKNIETEYTFVAASRTVSCADFLRFGLPRILLVVNVTRGVVIYNPSNPATTGALVGSTLTLTFNTTSHANTDVLQIFTDDGQLPASEEGNLRELTNTVAVLTELMTTLVERLDVFSDGQGRLQVALTGTTQQGNLSSVGLVSAVTNQVNIAGVDAGLLLRNGLLQNETQLFISTKT